MWLKMRTIFVFHCLWAHFRKGRSDLQAQRCWDEGSALQLTKRRVSLPVSGEKPNWATSTLDFLCFNCFDLHSCTALDLPDLLRMTGSCTGFLGGSFWLKPISNVLLFASASVHQDGTAC